MPLSSYLNLAVQMLVNFADGGQDPGDARGRFSARISVLLFHVPLLDQTLTVTTATLTFLHRLLL